MIVTDRLVFLHLHKSGGTFVNDLLLRFAPGARRIGYHLPRSLTPPELAHLPALGLVRNPWSYYVSWYSFQARRMRPNALFRVMSDGGRLDFAGTLRNLLALGSDSGGLLDAVLAQLPRQYVNHGLNLPAQALEPIRASRLGFYSFLHRHMYGAAGVLHLGRMERMREELPGMLTAAGESLGAEMQRFIAEGPARNVSEHAPYADYYDAELRALVAERDALVIERHGYEFAD